MAVKLLVPEESPLVFQKTVAEVLGLEGAIVVQQVYYLTCVRKVGKNHKGGKWVFYTYDGWRSEYFPFWSVQQIQRIFARLEAEGVIQSEQLDGGFSRRKYYRCPKSVAALFQGRKKSYPRRSNLNDRRSNLNDSRSNLNVLYIEEELHKRTSDDTSALRGGAGREESAWG